MSKKESGANYFASMTDMMVGILFIFIIMIAYFAFQVVSSNTENPLLVYIDRGEELRQGLAEKVADDLRKHNIDAVVNPKNPGVVTLRGREYLLMVPLVWIACQDLRKSLNTYLMFFLRRWIVLCMAHSQIH